MKFHKVSRTLCKTSLEIVQTHGCLWQSSADREFGLVSWKNRNILELPALVTARGHTENGTVMAAPTKQHDVRASFLLKVLMHPSCELQNILGLESFHF